MMRGGGHRTVQSGRAVRLTSPHSATVTCRSLAMMTIMMMMTMREAEAAGSSVAPAGGGVGAALSAALFGHERGAAAGTENAARYDAVLVICNVMYCDAYVSRRRYDAVLGAAFEAAPRLTVGELTRAASRGGNGLSRGETCVCRASVRARAARRRCAPLP